MSPLRRGLPVGEVGLLFRCSVWGQVVGEEAPHAAWRPFAVGAEGPPSSQVSGISLGLSVV